MFTGLIADVGSVTALDRDADGATLSIATSAAGELTQGASVAINGVCLTAEQISEHDFRAHAMNETLKRTALGALDVGSRVNVELPLRLGDRLGGHIVQGHVDATGTIVELREDGFALTVAIEADERILRYIVEKGSIAVDGVSLTVSELREEGFCVSLIPETRERTNMGQARLGAAVNLEVDVIAKHIEKLMSAGARI